MWIKERSDEAWGADMRYAHCGREGKTGSRLLDGVKAIAGQAPPLCVGFGGLRVDGPGPSRGPACPAQRNMQLQRQAEALLQLPKD